MQGCASNGHCNICLMVSGAWSHSHVVSALKYFHLLCCSLLHATPVHSLLRYIHAVQELVGPFANLSSRLTAQLCDAKYCWCCHSLQRMTFAGELLLLLCLPTPLTLVCGGESAHPAFGAPASISLHLASNSFTPSWSVHKSRGDSVFAGKSAGRMELRMNFLVKRLSAGTWSCREWATFVSCYFFPL